jgi:hypothetical protein
MSNRECATLCLTTYSGNSNPLNTSCTWNNINLRTILGPMYDKYDVFVLELNSVTHSQANAALGATDDDRMILIEISGLPLINNTFNCISNHNTNATIIAPFFFVQNETNYQIYSNSSKVTFGKNSDLVNITINLLDYYFSTPLSGHSYPNIVYLFNIFGIPKEEGDLNNTRMIR